MYIVSLLLRPLFGARAVSGGDLLRSMLYGVRMKSSDQVYCKVTVFRDGVVVGKMFL